MHLKIRVPMGNTEISRSTGRDNDHGFRFHLDDVIIMEWISKYVR